MERAEYGSGRGVRSAAVKMRPRPILNGDWRCDSDDVHGAKNGDMM
jgi:hypothetical protein